jgi:hypothetical protein
MLGNSRHFQHYLPPDTFRLNEFDGFAPALGFLVHCAFHHFLHFDMEFAPLSSTDDLLQVRGLLVERDAGVARSPDVAFNVAEDLNGICKVGYRATEGFHAGFVTNYGYVGSFSVEELFLVFLVAVWMAEIGRGTHVVAD